MKTRELSEAITVFTLGFWVNFKTHINANLTRHPVHSELINFINFICLFNHYLLFYCDLLDDVFAYIKMTTQILVAEKVSQKPICP